MNENDLLVGDEIIQVCEYKVPTSVPLDEADEVAVNAITMICYIHTYIHTYIYIHIYMFIYLFNIWYILHPSLSSPVGLPYLLSFFLGSLL